MSNTDGGPAFPAHENWRLDSGMTLRDYFAAQALQGQCTPFENGWALHKPDHREMMAAECYAIADAMLAERAK